MEVYASLRQFVFVGGHSKRDAARVFGLARETVDKICLFSVPPGYRRSKPPEKRKLGAYLGGIFSGHLEAVNRNLGTLIGMAGSDGGAGRLF